ncbi:MULTISPECIES: GH1 family beta-glucosidase [Streptomycetaceae]|uniref:Beta-glucosidase n=1 Tax=Streptantibioticus cattleyicolor (strain ATCC 35852 / DSM 46488 / JCM 4925 / NBRC 14057 / NRRL 8057) TaxID=1003195 RepID=F8JXM9_STREN|nr:GH1 family beta-glucosidase [Streptantibioticus cattleyicolor]AEW97130.1 putative beta-glucosidase [Streptantibioticus cattleyicolor NRRL 8057 = DSM 46488]MYS61590.1 beta-glucosidase [Streptomyces sp. SID5468]CCB77455.1 Thermostable beta-glucosidase B [Streptantibioticus cattleyicolor NRRL 8057 = DSM 46488]
MPRPLPTLPSDFVWGVSSSAYQIEGATTADGRGPSVWDTFAARPGAVRDGHTAETACDHYQRWPQDVALLSGLGVDAYRFSIAWPRVLPAGGGPVNPAGLDFYDRLTDALLAAGITPLPTLYHWDLPQALETTPDGAPGGWLLRDTAHRFAEYAAVVAARLGDRVRDWITLNEPFVHMVFGYALGNHAPGHALMLDALPAAHHQLLGHGLAAAALREAGGRVLVANNCTPVSAATDAPADRAAADAYDALHNRLFNDPLLLGRYPDLTAYGVTGDLGGAVRDGDLAVISAPLDGLGINYYNPTVVRAPEVGSPLPFEEAPQPGVARTAFDWPVVPEALRDLLLGLTRTYGDALPPLTVTENGCSYPGTDDPERIAFLDGHVRAVAEAVAAGADVRGYFVWTLTDNFEWAEGYHQRFGLVHVDHATQERTPKASYHWYRDLVAAHRGRRT